MRELPPVISNNQYAEIKKQQLERACQVYECVYEKMFLNKEPEISYKTAEGDTIIFDSFLSSGLKNIIASTYSDLYNMNRLHDASTITQKYKKSP